MVDQWREILARPTCSVEEWRAIIGLSKNPAYAAIARGEIEYVRVGGKIRIVTAPWREKLGLTRELVEKGAG